MNTEQEVENTTQGAGDGAEEMKAPSKKAKKAAPKAKAAKEASRARALREQSGQPRLGRAGLFLSSAKGR